MIEPSTIWADLRLRRAGFAAVGVLALASSLAHNLGGDVLATDLLPSIGGRPHELRRALARLVDERLIERVPGGIRVLEPLLLTGEGDGDTTSEEGDSDLDDDAPATQSVPADDTTRTQRRRLTDDERKERERAYDLKKKREKRAKLREASLSVPVAVPPSSPSLSLSVPPSRPLDLSPSVPVLSLSETNRNSLILSPEREPERGTATGTPRGDGGGQPRRPVPETTVGEKSALALEDGDHPPPWAHQEAEIRAIGTGVRVDVPAVWARFVAHAVSEGRTSASWRAAWKNWLANERPPSPGRAPRAGIIKQKSAPDAPWLKAGKAS